jgi:hypothetical protein
MPPGPPGGEGLALAGEIEEPMHRVGVRPFTVVQRAPVALESAVRPHGQQFLREAAVDGPVLRDLVLSVVGRAAAGASAAVF